MSTKIIVRNDNDNVNYDNVDDYDNEFVIEGVQKNIYKGENTHHSDPLNSVAKNSPTNPGI